MIPTAFEGEAKFPGGVDGCRRECAARSLDFGSFIYIGEYSTACACKAPASRGLGAGAPPRAESEGEAAVAAAVSGAELQRRFIQQQQVTQGGLVGGGVRPGLR
jgi:hypothetical protein